MSAMLVESFGSSLDLTGVLLDCVLLLDLPNYRYGFKIQLTS